MGTMSAMPAGNPPSRVPARNSRGKYARTLDSIERDRRAVELVTGLDVRLGR